MKSYLICGYLFSGKTTLLEHLSSLNYPIFEADKFVKNIYKCNNIGYNIIALNFGKEFVNEIEVKRNKLRNWVFNNKEEFNKLNFLIQPLIVNGIKQFYKKNLNRKVVFVECKVAIDYYEDYYKNLFDNALIIETSKDEIIKRAKRKNKENFIKNFNSINYEDYYLKAKNIFPNFLIINNTNLTKKEFLKKIINLI